MKSFLSLLLSSLILPALTLSAAETTGNSTPPAQPQTRITGSDLLNTSFTDALQRSVHIGDPAITTHFTGSRSGLNKLKNNESDLALISLAPGEKLPADPALVSLPIAYHTIVVAVPKSLSLSQMNFEQLDAIYCEDAPASIKRWGDIGAPGAWSARNIIPLTINATAGISFDLFRQTVLRSTRVRIGVLPFASNEAAIARMTSASDGTIAILSSPPEDPKLKTLSLAKSPQDIAYAPTPENLHSGKYPVRLPLYAVYRKADTAKLSPLLRYLLSEDALPAWESQNLIPLPLQVRNRQVFDLGLL